MQKNHYHFSHMATYSEVISKNLKKMIVNSGMSVEKIAFGSGVSKATLHNYLHKKRNPTIPVLEKIVKYLNRDFEDLFKK